MKKYLKTVLAAMTAAGFLTGCQETEPVKVPPPPPIRIDENLQSLDMQIVSANDKELILQQTEDQRLTLKSGSAAALFGKVPVIMTEPAIFQDGLWQLNRSMTENFLRPILKGNTGSFQKIVIDPGHGGRDNGAVSASGIKEKDLNLQLAAQLASALRARGFTVYLTRSDDRYLTLDERPAMIAGCQADLFISIHHNAAGNTAAAGHEIYVLRGENEREYALMRNSIPTAFAIEKVLAEIFPRSPVRGVKCARFKVLRLSPVPAILIEAGFVSNPDEVQILADAGYQQKFAEAVADALSRRL